MTEIKTGFMHKCGKGVKSWKRRWFVLKTNGYLYYYENKTCTREKGKIDIVDGAQRIATWFDVPTAERKLPNGLSQDRAFGIVCSDRTYTCVCEIDGESQSWINALNKVKDGIEQQYPPPTNPKSAEAQQSPVTDAPPPYTPTSAPPPTATPTTPTRNRAGVPLQMPQPQNYGGVPPPIGMPQPSPPYAQGSGTLPRNTTAAPPPQPIPRSNSYNPGAPPPHSTGSYVPSPPTSGAPPGGPGYTHNYPVGSYRPPPAPNPNYCPPRPMPQPQPAGYGPPPARYPPQPAYPPRPGYPPQPAYPPRYQSPPAAAYPPRPPPSAYPPRPQPMYRPPAAVPYQPPLRAGYAPPPVVQPQYRPVQMNQPATNVMVINLAAPTTRVVYR